MFRTVVLASALLITTGVPSMARAQAAGATIAEALFREGQALMQRGEIAEACKKFEASQAAQSALGTRLNLAVCHEREGKTASAWTEFAEVRAEASRAQDKQRKAYAEARLAALETRLRKIDVRVPAPVPGIEVTLDGRVIASAAWGSELPVDPGDHVIEARAPGFQPWTSKQTQAPGPGTDRIEVPKLTELSTSAPAPGGPPPAAPPLTEQSPKRVTIDDRALFESKSASGPSARRTLGLVVGGVGVASLGAGVFFAFTAQARADDRDEICAARVPCKTEDDFQRAQDAHDSARRAQVASLVTGGVGLAAIGVGAWLFLSSGSKRQSGALEIRPQLGPHTGGLMLKRAF